MKNNNKRFPIFPILLISLGVLILFGVIVSVIFLGSPIDSTQMVDSEVDIPNPEITRISLADAKSAFDTGKAIFVDVREKSIYDKGHIPGAKSIPLSEIEKRRGELDSRDWILLYCT